MGIKLQLCLLLKYNRQIPIGCRAGELLLPLRSSLHALWIYRMIPELAKTSIPLFNPLNFLFAP